jgi:hypothetical protein
MHKYVYRNMNSWLSYMVTLSVVDNQLHYLFLAF